MVWGINEIVTYHGYMTGISSVGWCHVCGEGEEGLKRGQAELHRGLDKPAHEGYVGEPKEQEGKEHSEEEELV